MNFGLDAYATSLGKLLTPAHFFEVPAFQRAYSWTTDEAGQLIEDLLLALGDADAQGAPRGYLLGPILLLDATRAGAPEESPRHLQIIDGQQRLATLTILACVLRDLLHKEGGGPFADLEHMIGTAEQGYRLRMRGGAQATMAANVQAPGSTLAEAPREDLCASAQLLLAVRDQFVEALADRDLGLLERFARFLHDGCAIVVITSRDVDRAHRTFAALNNRGRPLARCDIINAQLMEGMSGAELGRLQREWEELSARLGPSLDMLFSYVRTAIGDPRAPVISEISRLAAAAGGGGKFIDRVLIPYGRALADIRAASHRGSPSSAEINRHLQHLAWLPSTEWIPPLLLWWSKYGDDATALATFLRRLDRLAFGVRVLGLGADKRQARSHQIRGAIEKGRAVIADGGPLDLAAEEMRNIRHNLRDLHPRSQLTCKLVLMRIESEVAHDAARLDAEDLTVEHILPQKPALKSTWRSWFTDADERQACTGSLGNLVLVPRSLNERARNQDYEHKRAIFFAPDAPPLPILTEELRTVGTWDAARIRAREERMLATLDAMWQLSTSGASRASGESAGRRRPPKAEAAE